MTDFGLFKQHKWLYSVVALLIVASVVVRFWPILLDRPLWYDEVRTWQTAFNPSFIDLLTANAHKEHPPLNYLFVRLFMEVFGAGNFVAMRIPSLVFGVLCIPVAFAVGKRLLSGSAGLLFALLVSLDQLMIEQSQEARMYTLFMFLVLLTLLQFIIATEHEWVSTRQWLMLGVLLGALGWVHQLALVVWPGFVVGVGYFLLERRKSSVSVGGEGVLNVVALVFGTALLVDLPPLLQLLRRLKKPNGSGLSDGDFALKVLNTFSELFGGVWLAYAVLLVCVFGLFLLYRNGKGRVAVVVAVIGMMTLASLYPLSKVHHQISLRYLVTFLVVIWFGLVSCIVYARGYAKYLVIVVTLIYVSGAFSAVVKSTFIKTSQTRYLYGEAADFVVTHVRNGELVVAYPSHYSRFCDPYAYRHGHHNFLYFNDQEGAIKEKIDINPNGVWVVFAPNRVQKDLVRKKESLTGFYSMVADLEFPLKKSLPLPANYKQPIVLYFKEDQLLAYEVRAISANRGGVFPLSVDGFLEKK